MKAIVFGVSLGVLVVASPLLREGFADDAKPPTTETIRQKTLGVDDARLLKAASEPQNWLTYNGTVDEKRFSALDQVNDKNVSKLRLEWSFDTQSNRGLQATPLVVDGIMYTTAPWSVVFALDARTGKQLWTWDPKVPKEHGQKACCDVVNRGVALYKGKVYVGTLDARLAALDAATGKVLWQEQTADPKMPYTITGAPRIANGKVLIGNGGGEFGTRGYLSAYDAETGKLVWRSYTVPGDPAKPAESKAIEAAAKTWKGDEWLKIGAGGNAWDSIVYDPDLKMIYAGTGNGVAWNREDRSPGGGDNLYLSSIIALDAETGEMKWHYQTTPGDSWDFDSCQHLILADLDVKGKKRQVIMQAPKNGFFYVLDRKTGELLSAEKFADKVTWAKKVDLKTGRPIENAGQRYEKESSIVQPTPFGAHNWHPMSFSPKTGLVYIPAQEAIADFERQKDFKYVPGSWNIGLNLQKFKDLTRKLVSGHLLAWDPVKGKEAWRAQYRQIWNGGTLATAGNLVFQGTADGRFIAYSADKGKEVWDVRSGGGIIAGPMTYMVDGVQYVTVSVGWGGAFALVGGDAAAAGGVKAGGKVLTFALSKEGEKEPPQDAEIVEGEKLYHHWCSACHGAAAVSGGVLPDLRDLAEDKQKVFPQITKVGIPGTGMTGFGKWLTDYQVKAIQKYLRKRATDADSH